MSAYTAKAETLKMIRVGWLATRWCCLVLFFFNEFTNTAAKHAHSRHKKCFSSSVEMFSNEVVKATNCFKMLNFFG